MYSRLWFGRMRIRTKWLNMTMWTVRIRSGWGAVLVLSVHDLSVVSLGQAEFLFFCFSRISRVLCQYLDQYSSQIHVLHHYCVHMIPCKKKEGQKSQTARTRSFRAACNPTPFVQNLYRNPLTHTWVKSEIFKQNATKRKHLQELTDYNVFMPVVMR